MTPLPRPKANRRKPPTQGELKRGEIIDVFVPGPDGKARADMSGPLLLADVGPAPARAKTDAELEAEHRAQMVDRFEVGGEDE